MFGIYVGNSSACIVMLKDGEVQVLVNDVGNRVTSSSVEILDNERVVGASAKSGPNNTENVIYQSKMFLIPDNVAINGVEGYCSVTKEEENYKYIIDIGTKSIEVTPEEVATEIFKYLYKIAVSATQGTVESSMNAILSVPYAFSEEACEKYASAAMEAGFRVQQVISDTAAAILAYDRLSKIESYRKYFICRIGGTSVELSVAVVTGGVLEVLHSKYIPGLGGNLLTSVIFNYLAQDVESKMHFNPLDKPRCRMKLYKLAEHCKHILSTNSSTTCCLETFYNGMDYCQIITRSRIESVISSAVNQLTKPVRDTLIELNMQPGNVETVVLCGGTMKVPKIKKYFSDLFVNAEILASMPPDEVIAVGAAKQGLYTIDGLPHSVIRKDVLRLDTDVYLKTTNLHDCISLMEKGALLPSSVLHNVPTEGSEELDLKYYHGEPGNLELLKEVSLGPVDVSKEINAEVSVDSDGSFEHKILPC